MAKKTEVDNVIIYDSDPGYGKKGHLLVRGSDPNSKWGFSMKPLEVDQNLQLQVTVGGTPLKIKNVKKRRR